MPLRVVANWAVRSLGWGKSRVSWRNQSMPASNTGIEY